MTRLLHWGDAPPRSSAKRRLRDTVVVYGALSLGVVVFAWASGGSVARAAGVAALCFVVASAWAAFWLRPWGRARGERVAGRRR